jgi:hypothetical protein
MVLDESRRSRPCRKPNPWRLATLVTSLFGTSAMVGVATSIPSQDPKRGRQHHVQWSRNSGRLAPHHIYRSMHRKFLHSIMRQRSSPARPAPARSRGVTLSCLYPGTPKQRLECPQSGSTERYAAMRMMAASHRLEGRKESPGQVV